MSKKEKKIQEAVEKGFNIPEQQESIKAYQLLFSALEKEDNSMPRLSSSFADKVADRIEERGIARISFKEYVWKAAVLLLFLLSALIALFVVDADTKIFESLASIKWYIILTAFLLFIIDFADKKWVKKVI